MRFFDRKVTSLKLLLLLYPRDACSHSAACLQGFYSVHGEDALFIARQFYKTTAVVKYLGKQDHGLPGKSMSAQLKIEHMLVPKPSKHVCEVS